MTGAKIAAASSVSFLTASVAWLEAYGSTPLAAGLAVAGALLAMLESEGNRWSVKFFVLIFNALIGIVGGPIVALAVSEKLEADEPGVLLIASLVIGYLAHSLIGSFKLAVARKIADVVGWKK